MGGLPKRASLLANLRQEAAPLLILDSGNLLFRALKYPPEQLGQKTDHAKRIARALMSMDLTASGIGNLDLAASISFLERVSKETGLIWLSANLIDQTGKPVFKSFLIRDVAGIRIAIVGLTSLSGIQLDAGYQLVNWQETLPKILEELAEKSDLIILLSSYPTPTNEEIARHHNAINILLQSGSPANRPPHRINNTIICTSEARGKYLALLEIDWQKKASWEPDLITKQNLDRQHKTLQTRIQQIESTLSHDRLAGNDEYESLQNQLKQVQLDMNLLNQYEYNNGIKQSKYSYSFIPITTSIPEDPVVKSLLTKSNKP